MIRVIRVSVGALLLILAGCATRPDTEKFSNLNWESQGQRPIVSIPDESFAPPPAQIQKPPIAAQTPTNEIQETWIPLDRWCGVNGFQASRRVRLNPSPVYAVSSTNGTFMFNIGARPGFWNGIELRLGYAPRLTNGNVVVHTLDLKRTVQPLLAGNALGAFSGNPVIVIDPGHGGEDSGARSVLGGRSEKDYTLDWARRLGRLLAVNGWVVHLTRTNDSNIPLTNRVAFAEDRKAALFLSLHFNSAAPDVTQAGIETYCLTPTGMPSTITRGWVDDTRLVFPNNNFDAQNLLLAFHVHRALVQSNGSQDRGVRRARFLAVLRGQQRPAVLIEGGYLSNPREARLIATPAYRQKLAESVANVLPIPARTEPRLAALDETGVRSAPPAASASIEPGIPLHSGPSVTGNLIP